MVGPRGQLFNIFLKVDMRTDMRCDWTRPIEKLIVIKAEGPPFVILTH